jgi:dedicated sortase system histidine kinase
MIRLRIGIRVKLLFLSLFLFAIPWLGYQFVQEMESYLRAGQEQTLVGTARAVATALHERPKLFDNHASYLSDVKPGTDLYAHNIIDPIQLDGQLVDWLDYSQLAVNYGAEHLLEANVAYQTDSLNFKHMVGKYRNYLYAYFDVKDDSVVLRGENSLRVDRNDHLQIALLDEKDNFHRYIVATDSPGWVNAYLLDENLASNRPQKLETDIQGHWRLTDAGYVLEIRLPLSALSSQIAFAIVDVDDAEQREVKYSVGTANTSQSDSLGTVLVPSPEIESIVDGLKHSNARVWVLDRHKRVLARSGEIQKAVGINPRSTDKTGYAWWNHIEKNWLLPLYHRILTKPPADFIDELDNAFKLQGREVDQALVGTPDSLWRLSPDKKAVILSAAHPIWIEEEVMGAVVVEQTTHGIRSFRNKALEKLFNIILGVVIFGTFALFIFASRISSRIRKLRNDTERAIDFNGKIIGNIEPSKTKDEIGDLSRSFHNVLEKLGQYNTYLENMSARLSHELRTPVAIVNSSLENLQMENSNAESSPYIRRAKEGVLRLSKILSNMSEATRLENALRSTDREDFVANEVVLGCVEGYKLAYPNYKLITKVTDQVAALNGSPELFAQMLDKIVANAVEFSEEQAEILVTLEKKGQKTALMICNQGPLLPDNMQNELFDSMVSVRHQKDIQQPHLGLGLYIARIIADYHKGNVSIYNNEKSDGVCVRITLS